MVDEPAPTSDSEEVEFEDFLELLIRYFYGQSLLAKAMLEERTEKPPDFVSRLEDIQTVRRLLASNPRTPGNILQTLSKVEDKQTLLALVQNPATPQGVVNRILENATSELECALAASERISLSIRRTLANSPDDEVRWILAENPWVGDEILDSLSRADDGSGAVVWSLLQNVNTPRSALTHISNSDNDKRIREIASLQLRIRDLRDEIFSEEEGEGCHSCMYAQQLGEPSCSACGAEFR